jgi:group II intron reverse transcriptase/maturase
MRKDKKQQKKTPGEQLGMFSKTGEPLQGSIDGIDKPLVAGVELSSRLERQRTLTGNLLEKVVDYENLKRAFAQVRRNDGSSGVDGMEVEELRQWLGENLNLLREDLLNEKYAVSPVRKVKIAKSTGGTRMLGIPTVKDRFIQQAIHQQLSCYYEPHFSEYSYGFRPNRDAGQAILQAATYIREGKEWVVDIDLENFFDGINHDRLMQRLSKGLGDKRLLRLINAFLKAGMMEGGLTEQRISGTPQGGPLSPLLSNIVLDELDKEVEARGHSFCRYADDCNIYVKSKKAGERVLESVTEFIEKKLKLKVNRAKSGVKHCSDVKFLGYTLLSEGGIRVADQSINRFKDKVRDITRRNRGVEFSQLIKELNVAITGWSNYFRHANKWLATIRDMDGWIRRKLRCYKLKQSGRKYSIYKMLRKLGVAEGTSWNVVVYSQGWWHMSNREAVVQSMNLKWFALQGLQSLSVRMKV